jgi:hypothetical protein
MRDLRLVSSVLLLAASLLGGTPAGAAEPAGTSAEKSVSSLRGLLELAGIDESYFQNLTDGQPLEADAGETLVRILYRLPSIPVAKLERWRHATMEWPAVSSRAASLRGEVFRLEGLSREIRRVDLPAELARRLEFDHYYRVSMELQPGGQPAVICTRQLPRTWPDRGACRERIGAWGVLLKVTGGKEKEEAELAFAAPRLMWYPDRETASLGIERSHVFLAALGMDVALLDDMRTRDRGELTSQDSEWFYQLLAAVGRARPDALEQQPSRAVPIAALLTEPDSLRGRIFRLSGGLRRITRIEVTDAELAERFGIDHYFELDVFVSLGDEVIRLGEPRAGRDVPTFSNRYPVTVCVRSLPPGLRPGLDQREDIEMQAVFARLWVFRSGFVSSFDSGQLQPAPLFFGREPRMVERRPMISTSMARAFFAAAVVLFLLGGLALWRWQASEADVHRKIVRRWRRPSR